MSELLETLERIESTFAYNKKGKKNVYSIFMGEFKVIEEYYKDYDIIKQALERLEKLEKENKELKEQRLSLSLQLQDYDLIKKITLPNIFEENSNLINTIRKAIELLSVDGKGTKQEVKNLLKEVLKDEN